MLIDTTTANEMSIVVMNTNLLFFEVLGLLSHLHTCKPLEIDAVVPLRRPLGRVVVVENVIVVGIVVVVVFDLCVVAFV
jgi:hypothetical protein